VTVVISTEAVTLAPVVAFQVLVAALVVVAVIAAGSGHHGTVVYVLVAVLERVIVGLRLLVAAVLSAVVFSLVVIAVMVENMIQFWYLYYKAVSYSSSCTRNNSSN
jgi:hypothetical protein